MVLKGKKGQFFLIAALIIILIIFSLGAVYNSSISENSKSQKLQQSASEIKFESFSLINQGYYNNLNASQISYNIDVLLLAYSRLNPGTEISYVSGNSTPLISRTIINGSVVSNNSIVVEGSSVTLDLNNTNYKFNMTRGYNFFVILEEEEDDEKNIAIS